ncbi:hypothetical protein B0H67DRAFT_650468 [Lasiosphaeris hirsuta]|uniref:Uncharacterized protein n=1 Tax=Lasiosphaeris hirsuta TaxID=260670 RepID=A0AA39ZPE3_9PEZI|nr:hypothetical protein B0H67DRAFT_650468 [Lasiosphaeris hirsuta]
MSLPLVYLVLCGALAALLHLQLRLAIAARHRDLQAASAPEPNDDASSSSSGLPSPSPSLPLPSPVTSGASSPSSSIEPLHVRDCLPRGPRLRPRPQPRPDLRTRRYFSEPYEYEMDDAASVVLRPRVQVPCMPAFRRDSAYRGQEEDTSEYTSDGGSDASTVVGPPHSAALLETVVPPLELAFHNSFLPSPDWTLALHFSRDGDVAAYRCEEDQREPRHISPFTRLIDLGTARAEYGTLPADSPAIVVYNSHWRRALISLRVLVDLLSTNPPDSPSLHPPAVSALILAPPLPPARETTQSWASWLFSAVFSTLCSFGPSRPSYHFYLHPIMEEVSNLHAGYVDIAAMLPWDTANALNSTTIPAIEDREGDGFDAPHRYLASKTTGMPLGRFLDETASLIMDMCDSDRLDADTSFVRCPDTLHSQARLAEDTWRSVFSQTRSRYVYAAHSTLNCFRSFLRLQYWLEPARTKSELPNIFLDDFADALDPNKKVGWMVSEDVPNLKARLSTIMGALRSMSDFAAECISPETCATTRPTFEPVYQRDGYTKYSGMDMALSTRCTFQLLRPVYLALINPLERANRAIETWEEQHLAPVR